MKIKRLDVPDWITWELGEGFKRMGNGDLDKRYPETLAIVGKDGYYYDRCSKVSWMEYKGKSRLMSEVDFMYQLKKYIHIENMITEEEQKAIEQSLKKIKNRTLTTPIQEFLYMNGCLLKSIASRREAKKYAMKKFK